MLKKVGPLELYFQSAYLKGERWEGRDYRRIDDPDSTQHGTVNTAVTRRLARFGTGWIPWESALAELPTAISAMKDAVRERAETQPGCRSWSPPGSQTSECRSKFPSATTRRCSS